VGPIIEAVNLKKTFGDVEAVNGISFTVHEGEAFGFLGPNGAGKTTTMKMIQCVSPRSGGILRVFDRDVEEHPREIKQLMGVVPQEDNLDPDFTVRDNLIQYARYFDIPRDEARKRADELLDYVQLTEKKDTSIQNLSGGMKRRLILARALINNPRLLILDEPTTGLDPQARHLIWEKLRELVSEGNTIVLTTHYMEEAARICDRLVIMDQGTILVEGTPEDLVRTHVGEHIVEADRTGEVIACLEKNGIAYEIAGEMVEVYTDSPQEVTSLLLNDCVQSGVTARPATLEDVFLRLTGRKLRE
jgi:lipooligosaccharide transport system ATP-binding protein